MRSSSLHLAAVRRPGTVPPATGLRACPQIRSGEIHPVIPGGGQGPCPLLLIMARVPTTSDNAAVLDGQSRCMHPKEFPWAGSSQSCKIHVALSQGMFVLRQHSKIHVLQVNLTLGLYHWQWLLRLRFSLQASSIPHAAACWGTAAAAAAVRQLSYRINNSIRQCPQRL